MPTMREVRDLIHRFHTGSGAQVAVEQLSFTVDHDELVCIVGPSGCGKSTLLRCIAGLITPTSGTMALRGNAVTGVPKDLAVVFQDFSRSLFPWLSVRGNVAFPLHGRAANRAERRAMAVEALSSVGLSDVTSNYPWQLSGGIQQRVSIARALARTPALLLMDEPFTSVDAQTRAGLEDLLLRVRREHNSTVLVLTHDIDESVYLGDRVLVLSPSLDASSPTSPWAYRPSKTKSSPAAPPRSSTSAPRSPTCCTTHERSSPPNQPTQSQNIDQRAAVSRWWAGLGIVGLLQRADKLASANRDLPWC